MRHLSPVIVATVLAFITLSAHADDVLVTVINPVPFAEDSGASSNVKTECTLDSRLPQFIRAAAMRGVNVAVGVEPGDDADGKILYLVFTNIIGAGGGAWSGPKSVTVRGTLKENGETIGSFIATRYSTGGAFGGYKGTCSILGRCIKAIGKDVAAWLKNPTMNAMLGDT